MAAAAAGDGSDGGAAGGSGGNSSGGTYRRMAQRRWPGRLMRTKIRAEVRWWRAAPEM